MGQSGLLTPGNIDLTNRPRVKNPDGSISTVRSMSFEQDGKEVLVPTVVNGKVVSDEEAIAHYRKTGQHLGMFSTPDAATAYAEQLHQSEAGKLMGQQPAGFVPDGFEPDTAAADQPSAAARAAGQFYEKSPIGAAVNLVGGTAKAVGLTGEGFHPVDAVWGAIKGQAKAQWDQAVQAAQKAKEAAGGGGMLSASEAMGHGLAAVLPLLGPAAADVGQHFAEGDIAGGVGGTAGLLVPFAAKYGLEKANAANPAKAAVLARDAEQQVAGRVLAPGNPRFKGKAAAIAPEILKRNLQGGRLELQQFAEEGMDAAGANIDAAVNAHGGPQAPVPTQPIVDRLTTQIKELSPGGKAIPTAAGRVQHLTQLRDYVKNLGPDAPFDTIKTIRDDFYSEAAKKGGYDRAGQASLADAAWAAREGGSAIRETLATLQPDTAAHYADYTFWKTLNDVLDPAMGRPKTGTATTGVTGGLHTTGAIVGQDILKQIPGAGPFLVSKLLPMIAELRASPAWQLADASKKLALADAIKTGKMGRAQSLVLQIAKTAPRGLSPAEGTASTEEPSTPATVRR